MRVIHTIASTRLDHGGTSRSVPATCEALGQLGIDVHLITARPADLSILCNLPRVHTTVHTAVESRWLRQWGVPRQFRAMLNTICSEQPPNLTILHDHGLWLASNHASAKYSSKFHLPRVVSPRGMLGQWSMNHSRSRKQIAWRVFQYQDLKRATAFHATSDQEADDIRRVGLQQPIAVIPNGFSMPQTLPIRKNTDGLQALFLSRVHPKKGLIPLIQAWKNANLPSTWRLVLAGPDEGGHAAQVTQEIRRLNLEKCVRLIGPVDDQEKWQLYADSDLFVLPSFHENFGIVIAEAMAAGLPVITTTATPWKALQEKRLGWWIPPTVEAIRIALVEACALSPESLKQIGANAAVYVSENYSWQKTALELRTFYESILSDYGTERQRGRLSHEAR